MTTACPAYDGSVQTSWYPVCDVFTTRSPPDDTGAPNAMPGNTVPSSSASSAGPDAPIRGSTRASGRGSGGTTRGGGAITPPSHETHRPRGHGGHGSTSRLPP